MKFLVTIFVISALHLSAFANDDDFDTESCSAATGRNIIRYSGELGSVFISDAGVTRLGQFYPFHQEVIEENDGFVDFTKNQSVTSTIAFDLRRTHNAIIFLELYRRPSSEPKAGSISSWLSYFSTASFQLQRDLPVIYKFKYNIINFDRTQKIANATYAFINHYDKKEKIEYEGGIPYPNLRTPDVTIKELSDPMFLAAPILKDFLPYMRDQDRQFGILNEDHLVFNPCGN